MKDERKSERQRLREQKKAIRNRNKNKKGRIGEYVEISRRKRDDQNEEPLNRKEEVK